MFSRIITKQQVLLLIMQTPLSIPSSIFSIFLLKNSGIKKYQTAGKVCMFNNASTRGENVVTAEDAVV